LAAICIVAQLKKTIPSRLERRPFDSTLTQVHRVVNADLDAAKAACALEEAARRPASGPCRRLIRDPLGPTSPCYICFACVRFAAGGRGCMTEVLSERVRSILEEVVRLYLATGEPVASAAVARASSTGLSSPSIRNVMAELEELGYLAQPHASAGRIPSDLGFRAFVDELLHRPALPRREERRLRTLLAPVGPLEEGLARVSHVLADVTSEVGVALAPTNEEVKVRSLHFVQVGKQRVLAVVVTQGGLVDSRLLSVGHDYDDQELERISNFCAAKFGGLSLFEIRRQLMALMAEERARWDSLIAGVIELARQAVETGTSGRGEVFVQGTERLLDRVAPVQLDALRQLFAALADKALLLQLLDEYVEGDGPRAVLGSEFVIGGGSDLGLIVSAFRVATGERGLVGVIGPKRMDYPRIIPIVDFMGRYLTTIGGGPGSVQ
jgi:heat-inducible transcriptional repressor